MPRQVRKEIKYEYTFERHSRNYRVIVEIKIVKKDTFHPQGALYRFVLLEDKRRVICYDNHEKKGHHKHQNRKEILLDRNSDVFDILDSFIREIKEFENEKTQH